MVVGGTNRFNIYTALSVSGCGERS